jgi:hypothetical protein
MVVHACHHTDGGKLKIGGWWFRLAWEKRKTPISNITRAQNLGGVTQKV